VLAELFGVAEENRTELADKIVIALKSKGFVKVFDIGNVWFHCKKKNWIVVSVMTCIAKKYGANSKGHTEKINGETFEHCILDSVEEYSKRRTKKIKELE
jgi:hypothetical protein